MNKRVENVLEEALLESKPSKQEVEKINLYLKEFLAKFKKILSSSGIDAEVFVQGSFAKKTLIKKDKYDVDIFVRFDKKYLKEDLSELTSKILNKLKLKSPISRIHGSRDYFRVDMEPGLYFEIVPVMKVTNPKNAENITDLSYYHVKYINKRLDEKLSDDVILAKSFFSRQQRLWSGVSYKRILRIFFGTINSSLQRLLKIYI